MAKTWIVIQTVDKAGTGDRHAQVVSAVQAENEQEAISLAKQGWIWDGDADFWLEVEAVALNGEQVQVISSDY